jgi:hypothetical protein
MAGLQYRDAFQYKQRRQGCARITGADIRTGLSVFPSSNRQSHGKFFFLRTESEEESCMPKPRLHDIVYIEPFDRMFGQFFF